VIFVSQFADTNLFLRYLTNDVPAQADAVEALLRRAVDGEEIVLVTNSLVMAEIVWVLDDYYQQSRDDITLARQLTPWLP
jgi:predicted nucleic acid-binding protein